MKSSFEQRHLNFGNFVRGAGFVVAAMGGVVLIGWVFGLEALKSAIITLTKHSPKVVSNYRVTGRRNQTKPMNHSAIGL